MKYFHNNYDEVKNADFKQVPVKYVFEDLIYSWELPSSCCCILRATSPSTGKVKEYTYKSPLHAKRRLEDLLDKGYEVLALGHNDIAEFNFNEE